MTGPDFKKDPLKAVYWRLANIEARALEISSIHGRAASMGHELIGDVRELQDAIRPMIVEGDAV